MLAIVVSLAGAVAVNAQLAPSKRGLSALEHLTSMARLAAIRRAQVWHPTDVSAMDIKAGPQGSRSTNETVTCDFHVQSNVRPFAEILDCAINAGDEVKVKYGKTTVRSTPRWRPTAIVGAGVWRRPDVSRARGVPRVPGRIPSRELPRPTSGPVVIEAGRRSSEDSGKGHRNARDSGWAWPELDLVDEAARRRAHSQRDALHLLAVAASSTPTASRHSSGWSVSPSRSRKTVHVLRRS